MPTISFETSYKKNEQTVLSTDELKALYFYGIPLNVMDGTEISKDVFDFYIKSAQQDLEKNLGIKIKPTLITEQIDFYSSDYSKQFPTFKVSYPVVEAYSLVGLINRVEQVVYPQSYLSWKQTNDGISYQRYIDIVPTAASVSGNVDVVFLGMTSQIGLRRFSQIPNYWNVQYKTGYDKIPYDILNVIGKLAAINIFNVLGDIALGTAALASYSLSLDGLSQSISTTQSATNAAYGARILTYKKDVEESYKRLKKVYSRFSFTTL